MTFIIKTIAVTLTFVQLFGYSIATNSTQNDMGIKPKSSSSRYIDISNDTTIPVYKILNDKTGEYDIVSIFNDTNISSKQYGASQADFRNHFDDLIQDPLIWEEVQKYYPVNSFDNPDDATFYYKKYFEVIYENGCGYAAATDYVFRLFEGHEEEFFDHFGYSMYTYRNGEIDFNYELFMLKFFNYSVLDCNRNDLVKRIIIKDFYHHQMERLDKECSYRGILSSNVRSWTEDDWQTYRKLENERQKKYDEAEAKWKKATAEDINLGITLNSNFGNLHKYLKKYGIRSNAEYRHNTKKLATDDIVACDNFVLYAINGSGTVTTQQKVDLHYVYVVGYDDNGNIIVSSWGEKYILDNSKSPYTSQIRIKAK